MITTWVGDSHSHHPGARVSSRWAHGTGGTDAHFRCYCTADHQHYGGLDTERLVREWLVVNLGIVCANAIFDGRDVSCLLRPIGPSGQRAVRTSTAPRSAEEDGLHMRCEGDMFVAAPGVLLMAAHHAQSLRRPYR